MGDGNAPLAQQNLSPFPQRDRLRQLSYPQLWALEVYDEMSALLSGLTGGGPIQLIQKRGAFGQAGMGHIQPDARHARLKHLIQNVPFRTGIS